MNDENTLEIVTAGLADLEAEIAEFKKRPASRRRLYDWNVLRLRVHRFRKSIEGLPAVEPAILRKRSFDYPRQLEEQVQRLRAALIRKGLRII